MTRLTFRLTMKRSGELEPFVDWYDCDTKEQALEQWREDCHRYGIREADVASVEAVACNPDTLKPIEAKGGEA